MVDNLRLGALAACRAALRPLVRMMLKHGVMHKEFVELSKEIYVDVIRNDHGLRGRPTNLSRTALLTGLDRKEVGRIKKKLEARRGDESGPEQKQDRIARVLSGWHQDPQFVDIDGKPRTLVMEGAGPSFTELVKRFSGDVPAITILRELERTGALRVNKNGSVDALRRNYRLDTADPESLTRAGSVLKDIGDTVTHNLYRDAPEQSRFEARATNTSLPVSEMSAYREFIYRESQSFLENVDDWLSRHEVNNGESRTTPVQRVGLGVYWIQSNSNEATEL